MNGGRPKIIDEFTDRPVSRQRIKQLRWKRDGRCSICGKPHSATSANFCDKHAESATKFGRKYSSSKPWHPGGRGRIPNKVKFAAKEFDQT